MRTWYMVTVVGEDKPGIVANVTAELLRAQCNLGEASMMRLGTNFTIMLMAEFDGELASLTNNIAALEQQGLRVHIDAVANQDQQHLIPDVRITVYGADRAGIVQQVTEVLAKQQVNIVDLESAVSGASDKPVYIMHIDAKLAQDIDQLRNALSQVCGDEFTVDVEEIETMIG